MDLIDVVLGVPTNHPVVMDDQRFPYWNLWFPGSPILRTSRECATLKEMKSHDLQVSDFSASTFGGVADISLNLRCRKDQSLGHSSCGITFFTNFHSFFLAYYNPKESVLFVGSLCTPKGRFFAVDTIAAGVSSECGPKKEQSHGRAQSVEGAWGPG